MLYCNVVIMTSSHILQIVYSNLISQKISKQLHIISHIAAIIGRIRLYHLTGAHGYVGRPEF